ncbi:phospholipid scramblase-related protein [Agromyces bauzanensis]|uniref:Scramblase n=1 Tax=Agromyces bauzanensis TaxID=1308924 RepID=A0A917PUN5_9MICO|nr:phospholipid scramblase-related protein [Agromyces bauzanensis]GGJ92696.1 scramblase [Agromyces bauzanensis]
MSQQAPSGWFPDPFGRHEHRYWDGSQWTEHVGSQGRQLVDPPVVAPPTPVALQVAQQTAVIQPIAPSAPVNKKVQRQVRKLGVADMARTGGGTLLTEQILVVNQKAKLFEKRAEYAVFDQHGRKVGGVRQFGSSMSRMAVGRDNETKRFQIVDREGRPLMTLTRPATMLKSKVVVMREDGAFVGQIVQENFGVMASVLGGRFNIRFRIESDGETLGTISAESWRAWDFSIQDPRGAEIGRITKTWAGFGKENFTKADNYVLEMYRQLEDPLLSLVVSAALVVDTVLKQGSSDQRSR